jgi:hypothetical protein
MRFAKYKSQDDYQQVQIVTFKSIDEDDCEEDDDESTSYLRSSQKRPQPDTVFNHTKNLMMSQLEVPLLSGDHEVLS